MLLKISVLDYGRFYLYLYAWWREAVRNSFFPDGLKYVI